MWNNDSLTGSRAGAFRLLRCIGEGGSGAVYLAERVEEFEQTVAVKLLLDGRGEATSRFHAEKESLATLSHPGIVPIIDAGVSAAGIPYLAMQFVDGQPLDIYCAQHRPHLTTRVRIMIHILESIEFAHRRLIAHCDLKSSNVLVTADGMPHLLDFGIAKLLNPKQMGLGGNGPLTQNFRPLTPEFASPEQLRGEVLTTSTDLYSAGVLLFILLTGQHPFEELLEKPVDLLEAVCTSNPLPPSKRAARFPECPVSPHQLAGDLDAIVAKALEKDPRQRYGSAKEFAADLDCYLKGLPVVARQGPFLYRWWKFAARNRVLSAAAAIAALAVFTGTGATAWEGYRARQEQLRAEARFNQGRALANSLLDNFYGQIKKLPGAAKAQGVLITHAMQYLDELSGEQPTGALALELANGYLKMGVLQASSSQPQQSLAALDKARALAEAQAKDLTRDGASFSLLARVALEKADMLFRNGQVEQARAAAQAATKTSEPLAAAHPQEVEALLLAARCRKALGEITGSAGDEDFRRAQEWLRRARLLDANSAHVALASAEIWLKRGDRAAETDAQSAVARYQEAIHALDRLPAQTQQEVANRILRASVCRRIGAIEYKHGRPDPARQYLEEALRISDSLAAIDPQNAGIRQELTGTLQALEELEVRQHHDAEAGRYRARIVTAQQNQKL